MRQNIPRPCFLLVVAGLAGGPLGSASAADGYFLIGYGPRQKALAGAGAADQRDAMALSVNPAGIVGLRRQFQLGMTLINVERGYDTNGPTRVIAPGAVESGSPWFGIPNGGYIQPIDETSAWSVATYANGGVNTSYGSGAAGRPPRGGPFGGGFTGVDLQQAFASVGYARRMATPSGDLSIGLAPTLALQRLNVQGVGVFAPYSADPFRLSDMGDDWSWGGGLRAGVTLALTENARFGFSASTPMWMTRMAKYSGLLAGGGAFDIPASLQAGVAYDLLPNLTVMLDWRRIFHSTVPALANPTNPLVYGSMGTGSGPGFDWSDVDSGSVGLEWRYSPALALRSGYHYASNPLRWRSVTVNALAPIINRHHASLGASYALTPSSALDFAFVYGFKNSFTGVEWIPQKPALPFGAPNPRTTISPWVQGWELTFGYDYKWDQDDAAPVPLHF